MPSSSLSWQQGLAGRNPAISFLTSAENEMPTTSQGWCPATRTLFLPSSPPNVQSTEPVTARAPGTDLQPHTLLALYHTMVMARAIERRLWVLRRLEKMDFPVRVAGDWHEGINFAGAHSLPLICLVEDLASALPYAEHDNASPAARAEGYGLAAETIDGGDFEAALAAFQRAVARARAKGGPTLVHAAVVELTSRSL